MPEEINKQQLPLETVKMLYKQMQDNPLFKIIYPHREAVESLYQAEQFRLTIIAFLHETLNSLKTNLAQNYMVNGIDKSEFIRGRIATINELLIIPDQLASLESFEREVQKRLKEEGGN